HAPVLDEHGAHEGVRAGTPARLVCELYCSLEVARVALSGQRLSQNRGPFEPLVDSPVNVTSEAKVPAPGAVLGPLPCAGYATAPRGVPTRPLLRRRSRHPGAGAAAARGRRRVRGACPPQAVRAAAATRHPRPRPR